jgi:hypothetical protein
MIIFGKFDDDDNDDDVDVEVEVEADPFQKRHNHTNRLDGVTDLSLRRILFHETKQSIATTAGSSTYEDLSDGMMSKEDRNDRQGVKQQARRYQAVMGFGKERLHVVCNHVELTQRQHLKHPHSSPLPKQYPHQLALLSETTYNHTKPIPTTNPISSLLNNPPNLQHNIIEILVIPILRQHHQQLHDANIPRPAVLQLRRLLILAIRESRDQLRSALGERNGLE